ncbi:MAG: outer membrane beta-barrel protein [Desulforhopalus sp.]
MSEITNTKMITFLAILILALLPAVSHARDNNLRVGLSTSFDYFDRSFDDRSDDDDYQRIVLSPMVEFKSLSERDSFTLRAAPGIRYDLDDSDTEWDSNFDLAADRYFTRSWQLGVSNNFLRADYSDTDTDLSIDPTEASQEIAPSNDPQLSPDRGRRRYWRNKVALFSNHFYREDSLIRLNGNYIALRNDESGFRGDQDYDRYTVGILNNHRFNAKWKTNADFRFVRGDFEPSDSNVTTANDELSDDVKEYYLGFGLDNESIANNLLSLNYNFVSTKYDEDLQDDGDIHRMRLIWRRDFSSRMYTKLGGGPTYWKTEGRDSEFTWNGIAEFDYKVVEHGFLNFQVEKSTDVDNFSGSDERGIVDTWYSRLSGSYRLQKDLTLSGRLAYLYEDREDPQVNTGDIHKDRYTAGTALRYTFWQYYTAGIDYTYTTQDSDRVGDNYDDHRVLLTLSWEKDVLHW